jgi:serine/threonine protein kinase
MAPEQFDDDRPTRAMDVYSFGATLYFALIGRAPFSAVGIRSLLKEKEAGCPALEIAGLERPAVEALRSSLDVDATNRPDSCSELLNMLQSNPSGLSAVKPSSIPFRDNLKDKQVSQSESRSTLGTRVEPTTSAVDEKKSDKDSRPIPAPKSP